MHHGHLHHVILLVPFACFRVDDQSTFLDVEFLTVRYLDSKVVCLVIEDRVVEAWAFILWDMLWTFTVDGSATNLQMAFDGLDVLAIDFGRTLVHCQDHRVEAAGRGDNVAILAVLISRIVATFATELGRDALRFHRTGNRARAVVEARKPGKPS